MNPSNRTSPHSNDASKVSIPPATPAEHRTPSPLARHRKATPGRRGGAQGCWIGLAAAVLFCLAIGGCAVSTHNGIVTKEEKIEAGWAEIQNQYKRRLDAIPQLVATVSANADFEKSTLTELTEARASVGKVQLPDTLPTDPAQLEAYMAAQSKLGGALGRLFAVSENYPSLRATESFRDLQSQIEGTENRIAVARRDYIDAVTEFNSSIRRFPGSIVAGVIGAEKKPQLSFQDEGLEEAPTIEFGQ